MARFGFCGATYKSQSLAQDDQICMNWYPEADESGSGQSAIAMYPTPGTRTMFDPVTQLGIAKGQCQCLYALNTTLSTGATNQAGSYAFAVSGGSLYGINLPIANPILGTVADGFTTMAANNSAQLLICAANHLYVLNFLTFVFQEVTVDFNPLMIGFSDGYFVALSANSQKFYISALEDGTSWDDIDVAQVSEFPDNVLSMLVDHREIWLFGATKTIVYYNSGNPDFPFSPIPGAFIEQGIIAYQSAVRLDNSVFWIGGDDRGSGVAWRAQGYTPARVSNHAVEQIWQTYQTIADAEAYSYQENGHSFWVINFPTANATWVYDVATGQWHNRSLWENGIHNRQLGRCHCYLPINQLAVGTSQTGFHILGSRRDDGVLYWATNEVSYDDATGFGGGSNVPIIRDRLAPHISTEQQWTFHSQLQVLMDVGQASFSTASGVSEVNLDNAGNNLVTIADDGTVQGVPHSGTSQVIVFQDQSVPANFYQLGINAGLSAFTATLVAQPNIYLQNMPFVTTPSGLQTYISVSNGAVVVATPVLSQRGAIASLRWSDDMGQTWSNWYDVDCGALGQYRTRVIWRRLGRSRDRIYHLRCADPVQYRLVDAYLDAAPNFPIPTERYSAQMRKIS